MIDATSKRSVRVFIVSVYDIESISRTLAPIRMATITTSIVGIPTVRFGVLFHFLSKRAVGQLFPEAR